MGTPVKKSINQLILNIMETTDWNKVKKYRKVMAIGTAMPAKPEVYLFFYSVWTFVEGEQFQTLTEDQAEAKLKEFPDMEVHYCKLVKAPTNMPAILKGRKNVTTKEVEGHQELSDYIFSITLVRVQETDLMKKQNLYKR